MKPTVVQSHKIQTIRGLAIIAVVLIHNSPSGPSQVWIRPFLNFAVGTFLFLSGLLSDASRWNPRKRIMKILIPYIIWSFVYVVGKNIHSLSSIPLAYVKELITGKSARMMYYVFVYCELTLLIPLIDKLARSKYKKCGFIISFLEIFLFRLMPIVFGLELNKYITIIRSNSCLGWFSYFYYGYLLGNQYIHDSVSVKKLIVLLGGSILVQILETYWYYSMGVSNCGTQMKITAVITGMIFVTLVYKYIITEKYESNTFMEFVGNHSFGIFFCHVFIMYALDYIPGYSSYVPFPVNALITIGCSIMFILIIKKIIRKRAGYLAF